MSLVEQQSASAFFARNPIFRLSSFATALAKDAGRATAQVRYYADRGRLLSVVRGVYAVVPSDRDPATFVPDRYLVAATTREDACFCFHAALELLGLAHSVWADCTVYSKHRHSAIALGRDTVRFLPFARPLVQRGQVDLGTTMVERNGVALRVTGRERTLVEGLRTPSRVGGLSEVIECFTGVRTLRLDLVEALVAAHGEAKLAAAVGWYLESRAERLGVDDAMLARLEARRPRQRAYLDSARSGGRLARKWNLIVPESLWPMEEGSTPSSKGGMDAIAT